MARLQPEKLTDECQPQPDPSKLVDHPSAALRYPQISVTASFLELLSHSATSAMNTNESEYNHQESALSESWANISDAGNSLDEELQSETTDAASLVDNNGPDDVHSLDGRASDAGSHDASSEKDMTQGHPLSRDLEESTRTVASRIVAPLTCRPSGRISVLESNDTETRAEGEEVSQIVDTYSHEEAHRVVESAFSGNENSQIISSVHMTISAKTIDLGRPFRVLYIGGAVGRAEILAKIGDALVAGSEPGKSRHRLGSSLYHVVPSSNENLSSSDSPELIPVGTQITVDDCITAASIKHDEAPDQIFLSLKNGSLYSSRWTGTDYEISSACGWAQPDLAVFGVSHDDHPVLRQRHHLVHEFVSRHHVARLLISHTTNWASDFSHLPLDDWSPHLQIEAPTVNSLKEPYVVRRLPIDLRTFQSLDPDQLSKNFAFCCQRSKAQGSLKALSSLSVPSDGARQGHVDILSSRKRLNDHDASISSIWYSFWRDPAKRNVMMVAARTLVTVLLALTITIPIVLVAFLMSHDGTALETSPPTAWSLQPSSFAAAIDKVAGVQKTASITAPPTSALVPRSVATIFGSSDLMEVISSESLQAANNSEHFRVHSIGDGHIIVKTPRGFKCRKKAAPFDVVVSRNEQILDSALAPLFEGVYSVRVDRAEAYGILNVTIRLSKSSMTERYEVGFGTQWLKAAGWKKAAQIISEQVHNDLEAVHEAVSVVYGQALGNLQFELKVVSEKAARRAASFWNQSSPLLHSGASTLKSRLARLWITTNHERQKAYKVLSSTGRLAFRALLGSGHKMNEYGRATFGSLLVSASQTAQQIQDNAQSIDLSEVQIKMLDYTRSEYLAKAQERAKQLMKDAAGSLRREEALEKVARARVQDKGRLRNR